MKLMHCRIASGFTLIEVIIIIVVISILVMISYPRLIGINDKAYDTNIQLSIGTFRNLMSMFYQEHDKYPDTTNDFEELKNDILIEYGEIDDISEYIVSHDYSVDNDADPKTYQLELVSSKKNKTYIITPDGLTVTE